MTPYCVGIDLGSTTTKAVVMGEDGGVLGRGITNSRSNYTTACQVALSEALIAARFGLLAAEMEPGCLARFGLQFRRAQYRGQLRTLGGNTDAARERGLRTPRWRKRLLHALEERLAGPDGRLRLSFEIVYGHAFKAAPRLRVAEESAFPVESLRDMLRSGRGR